MAFDFDYGDNMPAAYEGQIANMVPATFISRTVEDTALPMGKPAAQGANDFGCHPFGSDDDAVIGIASRDRSAKPETPDSFDVGESARLMTQGAIWVRVSSDVTVGDPVTVTSAGSFSASGGTTVAGARFDTSADADGLALVRMTGGITDTTSAA